MCFPISTFLQYVARRIMIINLEIPQMRDQNWLMLENRNLKNDKLRVAWHGVGNTRARRTNTANRAPNMLTHHCYVSIPVCTISILWNFHTNPYQPTENYELKQQGDGAGETSITTNYELQGTGWATRAPVAQTLQSVRKTCSCTTATYPYRFARFPSCGIFTPTRETTG